MPDALPQHLHADAGADAGALAPWLASGLQRLSTRELFGAAREIEIEHGGAIYRLRITSMGRLILTK